MRDELQRYDTYGRMYGNAEGEFVTYDDHAAKVAALDARVITAHDCPLAHANGCMTGCKYHQLAHEVERLREALAWIKDDATYIEEAQKVAAVALAKGV